MEPDTALRIIKYTGAGIAALYGLYATITDFHETRMGKKVLSRRGYIGIVLLVAASALTIYGDVGKDRRDNEKEHLKEITAQKDQQARLENELMVRRSLDSQRESLASQQQNLITALTELRKTASTTAAVLHEAHRVDDPLQEITSIDVGLFVPMTADIVQPYLERLKDLETLDRGFEFCPKTSQFPDPVKATESALFDLAAAKRVRITIRGGDHKSPRPALSLDGDCNPDHWRVDRGVRDTLHLACRSFKLGSSTSGVPIKSQLDLIGASVIVELWTDYAGDPYPAEIIRKAPLTMEVYLSQKWERAIHVSSLKRVVVPRNGDADVAFVGTIKSEDIGAVTFAVSPCGIPVLE